MQRANYGSRPLLCARADEGIPNCLLEYEYEVLQGKMREIYMCVCVCVLTEYAVSSN